MPLSFIIHNHDFILFETHNIYLVPMRANTTYPSSKIGYGNTQPPGRWRSVQDKASALKRRCGGMEKNGVAVVAIVLQSQRHTADQIGATIRPRVKSPGKAGCPSVERLKGAENLEPPETAIQSNEPQSHNEKLSDSPFRKIATQLSTNEQLRTYAHDPLKQVKSNRQPHSMSGGRDFPSDFHQRPFRKIQAALFTWLCADFFSELNSARSWLFRY